MASQTKTWIGNAAARSQALQCYPAVTTLAPVWKLTINGKTLKVTSNGTSADAVSKMYTAWRNSSYPEFKEITPVIVSSTTTNPQGDGTNCIQSISIGSATGGSFGLTFVTDSTAFLLNPTAAPGLADSGIAGSPNGAYRYVYTFTNTNAVGLAGETAPSPEATITVTSHKVTVTIPVGPTGTTGRKIYRTVAGGAAGTEQLVATISDNTTTSYTDNTADGSLGAAVTTSNTTGIPYNATAQQLQNILQELGSIGAGNCTVTGSGTASDPWLVQFVGEKAGTDLALLVCSGTAGSEQFALLGTSTAPTITQTQKGVAHDTAPTTGYLLLTSSKPGVPWSITSQISGQLTPAVVVSISTQGVDAVNEVQSIYLGGSPTGGTFTLTFGGDTTGTIAYNASAATVQTALQGLASIGAGNCTVTGAGTSASPWKVAFGGTLADAPQSLITGDASSVTGAGVKVTETQAGEPGTNEVQEFYVEGNTDPNGYTGFFYMSFSSGVTIQIAYPPTQSNLQAAYDEGVFRTQLGGISTGSLVASAVTTGTVTVSNVQRTYYRWTVTYENSLAAQDVPQMTFGNGGTGYPFANVKYADGQAFDSTNSSYWYKTDTQGTASGVDEIQQISLPYSPVSGTFTLSFGGHTTVAIAYNATAATVQSDLEALASIGTGNIAVSGSAGGPWTATFQGTLGSASQALITGDATSLVGDTINISHFISGNAGTTEVQTITLQNTASGTFAISFNGVESSSIAYNASAATMQTAIQGISTVGSGNATVSGSAGGPWTVTFAGTLVKKSLPPFAVADTSLLNGTVTTLTDYPTILAYAKGPNFWDDDQNWSPNAKPVFVLASAPVAATAFATSGGSLAATTYYYKVTAYTANGETTASNEVSATTSGSNLTVAIWWDQVEFAAGYKVYRGTSAGSETLLVATIDNPYQTVFNDDGTETTSSASPPGVNTAVGDDVVFENSTVSCWYNIDQDYGLLNSFDEPASYTGKVGLTAWNPLGYQEYRPLALKVRSPFITIGEGAGSGTSYTNIDTGTGQTAIVIANTASTTGSTPAVLWTGSHASNTIKLTKGSLGVAIYESQSAIVSSINQSYLNNPRSDTNLIVGPNVTLTTLTKSGGDTTLLSGLQDLTATGGTITHEAGGITGTLTITNATFTSQSSGNIGTLIINAGGDFDRSGDGRAITITNTSLYAGATLRDPLFSIAFTNPYELVQCGYEDVTLQVGKNLSAGRTKL